MRGVIKAVGSSNSDLDDTIMMQSSPFFRAGLIDDYNTSRFQQEKNTANFIGMPIINFANWQNGHSEASTKQPSKQPQYQERQNCRGGWKTQLSKSIVQHEPNSLNRCKCSRKQEKTQLYHTFKNSTN